MKTNRIIDSFLPPYGVSKNQFIFFGNLDGPFDFKRMASPQDQTTLGGVKNELQAVGGSSNTDPDIDPTTMPAVLDSGNLASVDDDINAVATGAINNMGKITAQNPDNLNTVRGHLNATQGGPNAVSSVPATLSNAPAGAPTAAPNAPVDQKEVMMKQARDILAKIQSLDLTNPRAREEMNTLQEQLKKVLPPLDSPNLTPEQKEILEAANEAVVARQEVLNYGIERRTKYLSAHGKSFGEILTKGDGGDVVRSAAIVGLILWGAYHAMKSKDGTGKALGVLAVLGGVGLATQFASDGKFKVERLWNKQDQLDHEASKQHMGNINKMQELYAIDGLAEATRGMIVRKDSPKQRPDQMSLEEFFDQKARTGGPFTMTDEDLKKIIGFEEMPNFTGKQNEELLRKNYYTELFQLYSVCQRNSEPTIRDAVRGFSAVGNYTQAITEGVTGTAMGAGKWVNDKAHATYNKYAPPSAPGNPAPGSTASSTPAT